MKRYDQYSAEPRRILRQMYASHPQPRRVMPSVAGIYEGLERDGWVKRIGRQSVVLTDKAVFLMSTGQ